MNELSKDAVKWLAVDEEAAGQRIDNFLVRLLKGVPKSHVYRILRRGEVRVNSKRVGPDARLAAATRARAAGADRDARRAGSRAATRRRERSLPVLFEDDALLAIDKPAGLAVHGGSGIAPA